MTREAVAVLAARSSAVDLATLDDTPSRVPGWSRLDVGRHLTDLLERVVGPARRPDRDDDVAARGDAGIAAMTVGADDVAIRYADALGAVLRRLGQAQVPVAGDLLVHFGTAGQHPTHLWADGLVYEHVVHAGLDLGVDAWAPDAEPDVVGPAIGWVVSSLPQVNAAGLLAVLDAPFGVRITAPLDLAISVWGVGDGVAIGVGIAASAAASVTVTPAALLAAVSGRQPWETIGDVVGDADFAARVMDEMRIGT